MLNNKKIFLSFVGLLFMSLFALNFVSAAFNLGYSMDRGAYYIQPVAQFFLGGYDYTGYMLFERFLFFIIILSITFVALVRAPFFEKQKNVVIVLSVVVPLLSVRYISFEWLNTMLMAYQVFGIALTSLIPFVIYFFFLIGIAPLESGYSGIRKIGWILYGCVYLGLYTTAENQFYGQVYIWTALGALVFFLLDKTIQNYFIDQRLKYNSNKQLLTRQLELEGQRKKLLDAGALDPKSPYHNSLKDLNKELASIRQEIKRN